MSEDRWIFYRDSRNKWRWRRTAANGLVVGASTQGYVWKYSAKRNAKRNGWPGPERRGGPLTPAI